MSTPALRLLFFPRERYPTDRVRITTLFGRELLGRGHEIDLVMQAASESVQVGRHAWHGRSIQVGRTDDGRGPLHRARRAALGLLHDLRWLIRARRQDYDGILVSDKYLVGVIASTVAKLRGMKFLFWMTYPYHQAQVTLGLENLARAPLLSLLRGRIAGFFLRYWILPRSAHVFVQSQRMAEDFAALGVDQQRMTPIVTGIDLAGFVAAGARPPPGRDGVLTVGYLGTLVRQRRLDILVDMIVELRKRGLRAHLLLVGDGASLDDRNLIEQRARDLGVESQVEITGFLPRMEALSRICSADVCVSPFRPSPALEVASPTKLVEYLALGLPVVANVHPDQSHVLRQSRAGVRVPWGARHFARAVHWIVRRSEAERGAMAARGQAWVQRHRTYAGIADDFEEGCRRGGLLRAPASWAGPVDDQTGV